MLFSFLFLELVVGATVLFYFVCGVLNFCGLAEYVVLGKRG